MNVPTACSFPWEAYALAVTEGVCAYLLPQRELLRYPEIVAAGDIPALGLDADSALSRRASYGGLSFLLAKELACLPSDLHFCRAGHGKPLLQNFQDYTLQFNLSHSGDYALLAYSHQYSLGVDIEQQRHKVQIEGISKLLFSPEECRDLALLKGTAKRRAFFALWVQYEALSKLEGTGLLASIQPTQAYQLRCGILEQELPYNWAVCWRSEAS